MLIASGEGGCHGGARGGIPCEIYADIDTRGVRGTAVALSWTGGDTTGIVAGAATPGDRGAGRCTRARGDSSFAGRGVAASIKNHLP